MGLSSRRVLLYQMHRVDTITATYVTRLLHVAAVVCCSAQVNGSRGYRYEPKCPTRLTRRASQTGIGVDPRSGSNVDCVAVLAMSGWSPADSMLRRLANRRTSERVPGKRSSA